MSAQKYRSWDIAGVDVIRTGDIGVGVVEDNSVQVEWEDVFEAVFGEVELLPGLGSAGLEGGK